MDILRIPIKFGKPISRLSSEERGYIFSSLFSLANGEEIDHRDDNVGDLLDLIWFECLKMWEWADIWSKQWHHWKKGWRPKKTPLGLENETPRGNPKGNSNSKNKYKDKEKDKEEVNNEIIEYYEDIRNNDTLFWQLVDYWTKLWYTPAKDETLTSLDEYIWKVFTDNKVNIDTAKWVDTAKSALYRWYTYWKDDWTKIKNFKTKFSNTIQYSIK